MVSPPSPTRRRPEYISDAWEQYRKEWRKLPDAPSHVPVHLPSTGRLVVGAHEGKHSATIFTPYFPTGLDADENRSWKEQYADACVQIFDKYAPGFADSVTNRVVFSNRYFTAAPSARTPVTTLTWPAAAQPAVDRPRRRRSRQIRHAGPRALSLRPVHPPRPRGDWHPRVERRRSGSQAPQRARLLAARLGPPPRTGTARYSVHNGYANGSSLPAAQLRWPPSGSCRGQGLQCPRR